MRLEGKKAHHLRWWHRIFHRSPEPIQDAVKDGLDTCVGAIALPPAEDSNRNTNCSRGGLLDHPEARSRIQAALNRGSQSEGAQMTFAQMLGGPAHRL